MATLGKLQKKRDEDKLMDFWKEVLAIVVALWLKDEFDSLWCWFSRGVKPSEQGKHR